VSDDFDALLQLSVLEEQFATHVCLCAKHDHGHPSGDCRNPAAVVVSLHMVMNCKRARLARPDLIDEDGNGRQILCTGCWEAMQGWVRAGIALTATMTELLGTLPAVCDCGRDVSDYAQLVHVVGRFDEHGVYREEH
jgi:hypothetical protein